MQKAQSLKIVAALMLSMLATGAAKAQKESAVPKDSLSRAEVVRDMQAWKQSGLAEEWRTENTPDVYSPAYLEKYEAYLRMTQRPAAPSASPSQAQPEPRG